MAICPLRICGISSVAAICMLQKQKSERFCNFSAIRDSLLPSQSGNEPFCGRFAAFLGRNPRFGAPRQSLIANKLHFGPHFCFWGPRTTLSAKLLRGTFACISRMAMGGGGLSAENKNGLLKASLYHVKWCPRRDLNPHVFRQRFLRPPRLPFRHSGAELHYT